MTFMKTFMAVFIALSGVVLIFAYTYLDSGMITIQRSYLNEYNQCKADLEKAVTPQCAPVECKDGSGGVVLGVIWTIGGVLFYGLGFWYNLSRTQRADEKTKQADEYYNNKRSEADKLLQDAKTAAAQPPKRGPGRPKKVRP